MAVIADVLASRQVSKDEAVIKGEPVIYILDIGVTPVPVTLGSDEGSDKSASDERFHFDREKDIFDYKL